ncbi:MAG TPA: hypothetical protein VG733_15250, partial [Chthoniobacteraceae bacterium]|nr:hypothetical protein [Chthoniobacteraceae bacterium]
VDLNRAIDLDATDATAYYSRGSAKAYKDDLDGAIIDYNRSIQLNPKYTAAYHDRGIAKKLKRDFQGAISDQSHAIELNPNLAGAYNDIAWILATANDLSVRDGESAVKYAIKACELSKWMDPNNIDTLAAAYAESGNFDKAVALEQKYLESNSDDKDAQARLKLYRNHQPYRDIDKQSTPITEKGA